MDFPLFHGAKHEALGAVAATSSGTVITSSSTAHTKGSWSTIAASVPAGVVGFWLHIHYPSSYRYNLDIGIGPTDSEVIVVGDLHWYTRSYVGGLSVYVPMALPAGVRVAARCQSGGSSATITVSLTVVRGPFVSSSPLNQYSNYGTVPASTEGTEIDPGATPNTKGSWVEIVSSTVRPIQSLILCFSGGTGQATPPSRATAQWLFDVAVGAEDSEQIILPDIPVMCTYMDDCLEQSIKGPFDVSIPAGSRIAVRSQCSTGSSPDRLLGIVLLGFC